MKHQNELHNRIRMALGNDSALRSAITRDFNGIFRDLGVQPEQAAKITGDIFITLSGSSHLNLAESAIYHRLAETPTDSGVTLPQAAEKQVTLKRANIVYGRINPHLKAVRGHIINFGMRSINPDIPKSKFPDGHFSASIANNILHRAPDPEGCIEELSRITSDKIIVIETVPSGPDIKSDRERTFMNLYLFDRLLSPPEGYKRAINALETAESWTERFNRHGWKAVHSRNLGTQPVLADTHHLLVFERA
jgi:hypothetical protein